MLNYFSRRLEFYISYLGTTQPGSNDAPVIQGPELPLVLDKPYGREIVRFQFARTQVIDRVQDGPRLTAAA